MRPNADIAAVRASHKRLLATVEHLDDRAAASPSLLPDWNVAMVLTHLARHADGQCIGIAAAVEGEIRARYPTIDARNAGIEVGRNTTADQLRADLGGAVERLEAAYDSIPDDIWHTGATYRVADIDREPMRELPFQRWREVEVHHADLGLGYTPADWPRELAVRWLPELISTLPDRADPHDLMAWTLGRGPAPTLEPWR